MKKHNVAIVRYREKLKSVREAVELSGAFENIPKAGKIFIKPNIVFWTKEAVFPKYGVITTSRVVEDVIIILKEMGINDITVGEGIITLKPGDRENCMHAFEKLGYNNFKKKYGIKCLDIFTRPFRKINIGDSIDLSFNVDILDSDYIINLPVLKTHAQTVVSLGMKNFKGIIDMNSRKKCHSTDKTHELNYMISKIAEVLPPSSTVIDGIYTIERGPTFDGSPRRSNLIIASSDMISADMVGAKVLGHDPEKIPYLNMAAKQHNRPINLSGIEIKGESIENVQSYHEYTFPYNKDNTLPITMSLMGIKGLSYNKFDTTLCTYCSLLTGAMLTSIAYAWKGKPWNDIEVLTGKKMTPAPGKKKTILLGQCMCNLNRSNANINELIEIKGCPPKPEDASIALQKAGIEINPYIFTNLEKSTGLLMSKYAKKPEFEESFYEYE